VSGVGDRAHADEASGGGDGRRWSEFPIRFRTESIKAGIVLRPGLRRTMRWRGRSGICLKVQLAAHEYRVSCSSPTTLPMTATGKVLRRELRALG